MTIINTMNIKKPSFKVERGKKHSFGTINANMTNLPVDFLCHVESLEIWDG